MFIKDHGGEIELSGVTDFDLKRTFECGQCFRWHADEAGAYSGVAFGHTARLRRDGERLILSGKIEDFEKVWRGYFDLDRDYAVIRRRLCVDDYMTAASDCGAGIRILRQEPWEALATFILSQCNNIPRITQIVEAFCRLFGEQISFEGKMYGTFPAAERIAGLSLDDLAPLRAGYRAPYLLGAARAVADGTLDLDALSLGTAEDAAQALKALEGVGDKVAGCVVLFGLHFLDAFPVDTWMKKAIAENYGGRLDPAIFSPYAGVAQQYMFYHARCTAK